MPSHVSMLQSLASLDAKQRAKALKLAGLTDAELSALLDAWCFTARPEQIPPPGDWSKWLILAGRGFGKTRTGAEWIREMHRHVGRMALVAPTSADARDTMVEGESGLLAICPPTERPLYEPSKRRLTFPNGAIATLYSAEEPERLRGPQHGCAWADEAAAWKYPTETWDMLMFGLRLGTNPRVIVTTTPKPIRLIRDLLADPTCVVTRGSTYDNRANLPAAYFESIIRKYEGTRLGRQELHAEVLDDVPGALWQRVMLDTHRVTEAPHLRRIVVGVDPSVTNNEESAEAGIVVGGIGDDGHGYIIDDKSRRDSPLGWAKQAVTAYHTHAADRLVAEVNNGGDMVELTIHTVDKTVAYKGVRAAKGKVARAEPIAALYEQGRVHHVGVFDDLEDQLCQYVAGEDSPDRLDALVWALTELMLERECDFAF